MFYTYVTKIFKNVRRAFAECNFQCHSGSFTVVEAAKNPDALSELYEYLIYIYSKNSEMTHKFFHRDDLNCAGCRESRNCDRDFASSIGSE